MNDAFELLLKQDKLPQVLLFSGPKERFTDLKNYAKKLLGQAHAAKIDSGNHPDVHIYHPEGAALLHPIESMKNLIELSAFTPHEAFVKIFMIDQAERMLPSSSNALLKTLEEPEKDTFIWLFTSHPEALLPTIVSRCRHIPLHAQTTASEETISMVHCLEAALKQDYMSLIKQLNDLDTKLKDITVDAFSKLLEQLLRDYDQLQQRALTSTKIAKILNLLENCTLAFERHIKPRSILLHFLMAL